MGSGSFLFSVVIPMVEVLQIGIQLPLASRQKTLIHDLPFYVNFLRFKNALTSNSFGKKSHLRYAGSLIIFQNVMKFLT